MLLTLVRHAKSSWSDPSLSDFDRPLNKRGNRDGGLMVNITILKRDNLVTVLQPSYYLSWVHKFRNKKGNNYQILPCFLYEKNKLEISKKSQSKMTRFIKKSRALFKKENISFVEQLN